MRMLRGKFQGPQLSVNQAQGSLHYHQWIELPFLGSCLLPESRAGEKSLADRQWLELIHSIRNSSVLDLASLLDMGFLKLWTLQMTSTENRTRFPYAKFFVMHSILLYSSLRLSFKNHPSSGLDFSDPGKLPEGRVKPGAASSCSSAVMCSSYLILMLPSWRNLAAGLRADTQKQVMSSSHLIYCPESPRAFTLSGYPPASSKTYRLPRFEGPTEMYMDFISELCGSQYSSVPRFSQWT